MSQENVEITRASFEAWNAGDRDFLSFHPDLVYTQALAALGLKAASRSATYPATLPGR
jgi:ketosteroid isomerase-like protein